ncbi:hypothetical protein LG3211_3030 [Lysobacter gummosus]|nr:hypothetical protein LG3211_3030 [Lysobacter gummosus]
MHKSSSIQARRVGARGPDPLPWTRSPCRLKRYRARRLKNGLNGLNGGIVAIHWQNRSAVMHVAYDSQGMAKGGAIGTWAFAGIGA